MIQDRATPSDAEAFPVSGRPRPVVLVLSGLAGVLAVASAVLFFVGTAQQDERDDARAAREAALQAGRQAILNLDALSAATIDRDLARVLAQATGTFKEQFAKAQADLKELVVGRKTVSTGTILSAGIVRSDSDTATVLVAVDRLVKDTGTPDGVTAHDRWKLHLELRGGRWLVAELEAVA